MNRHIESFESRSPRVVAKQTSALVALPVKTLEHGAYYVGKLGVTTTVARWHAKKQRFLFEEFNLGQQRVRSVVHATAGGPEQRFFPLSRIEPNNTQRLSDYAFETAG